jgi:hypothetical protein
MRHRHPEDRVYTVVSGVFYIGLGGEFDPDKLEAYPPGSVIVLPGNTPHFYWAKSSEYVTQVTAIGRLALNTSAPTTIPGTTDNKQSERFPRQCTARNSESTMIIAKIETFPLRIPFKPGVRASFCLTLSPWSNIRCSFPLFVRGRGTRGANTFVRAPVSYHVVVLTIASCRTCELLLCGQQGGNS